jgi:hypothetical protein
MGTVESMAGRSVQEHFLAPSLVEDLLDIVRTKRENISVGDSSSIRSAFDPNVNFCAEWMPKTLISLKNG